ncbi:hypothetical protein SDC9_113762 [bioreactor metagenome]|uniref:Uncharacterized protein n=1 Tax=bioreactor metagenome TaxID=1076179 RepID=A0A645BMY2_9ZZZZ
MTGTKDLCRMKMGYSDTMHVSHYQSMQNEIFSHHPQHHSSDNSLRDDYQNNVKRY